MGGVIGVVQMLAALLTGVVVVALFRGVVQRLAASAAEQTPLSTLLGFAAFLVFPVTAGFAMVVSARRHLGLGAGAA